MIRIGTDGGGRTGRTRRVVTGAERRESLGEQGGLERELIGTARAAGLGATGPRKYPRASTLGGYVSAYGSFYGGRSGQRTGAGTAGSSNPFRSVQHMKQSEQGNGIRPERNVPGQYGPGRIPVNQYHKVYLYI